MTNSTDEPGGHGIEDEELPEDLKPGEDNPLAEGLDDAETAGDLEPGELLREGKSASESEESEQSVESAESEGESDPA